MAMLKWLWNTVIDHRLFWRQTRRSSKMKIVLLAMSAIVASYLVYDRWVTSALAPESGSVADQAPLIALTPRYRVEEEPKSARPEKPAVVVSREELPPANEAVTSGSLPERTPVDIDLGIKSRVLKLFREWKLRNAGTEKKQVGGAFKVDMAELLTEIKLRGPHTEQGIKNLMIRVLREAGVGRDEVEFVADGILSEARRDGSIKGHHRANRLTSP